MRGNSRKDITILFIVGFFAIIYFALLIAPICQNGLLVFIEKFPDILKEPFNITIIDNSLKTVLVVVVLYCLFVVYVIVNKKKYRHGREHGSAEWGAIEKVKKSIGNSSQDKVPEKVLTNTIGISYNAKKHRRNLNTIIVGGSGAGKTRFFAKPNLMQANTSFVVLDPKGELVRDCGHLLKEKGYIVKVLDLINTDKSHSYNPLLYVKDDNDIQRLVSNLFKSTTPKGSQSSDPFWDTAGQMLLMAILLYLYYFAIEEEQTFSTAMEMIRQGEVKEEDENYQSVLDAMFSKVEQYDSEHICLKYYKNYKSGSGKTLKSIQITLISRLEKFNLKSLAELTMTDELELDKLGEQKMVIFCVIPDNDDSFNFLISILYTQLFQQLYYSADYKHGGSLPVPVHFLMDEFANVSLPNKFDDILSTMRSRNISVSIILQNISQLKALYEKEWESIRGNCDTFLYLGGNELSTHEYISKMLGKENIDTNTYGRTWGERGNASTNYQSAGRDLMTPDEVMMMDNRYALLFVRGERPIMDLKFDILKHPNIKLSADGNKKLTYIHGKMSNELVSAKVEIVDINLLSEEEKNSMTTIYEWQLKEMMKEEGVYFYDEETIFNDEEESK